MAKLNSHLKISGTLDDISFCQQQDKSVIVQTKTGPTSKQVKKSKRFAKTRLYGDEFRTAARHGQLLRRALGDLELALRCRKLNAHVIQRMRQIADTDLESPLGFRNANNGDLSLLSDFEFNHALNFDIAMPLRIEHAMNAETGKAKLWVRSGIVRKKKALPETATHYKIVSILAALDLDTGRYTHDMSASDVLPLSKQMPELQLLQQVTGKPGQVMVHCIGIVFFDSKGKLLKGGAVRLAEVARVGQEMKEEKGGKEGVQVGVEAVVMAAPTFGMVAPVRVAEKKRCAECSVEGSWLVVAEVKAVVNDTPTPALSDAMEELVADARDGFELGMVDARGMPLQDREEQQAIIDSTKAGRKEERLKGSLRQRE